MHKNETLSSVLLIRIIFWLENLKGRDHLEELGVDVRIILECRILGK